MNKMNRVIDRAKEESIADYYKSHPIAQEQHHAMHALTLIYFMVRKTLRRLEVKPSLVKSIIRHLMDLREFLEDPVITALVNRLWKSLETECKKPGLNIYPWAVSYQDKVLQLARYYRKENIFRDLFVDKK